MVVHKVFSRVKYIELFRRRASKVFGEPLPQHVCIYLQCSVFERGDFDMCSTPVWLIPVASVANEVILEPGIGRFC